MVTRSVFNVNRGFMAALYPMGGRTNRSCRFARLIGYDGGMKFRPRYSLRTLFAIVAVIAGFCGYLVCLKNTIARRGKSW